MNIDDGGFPVDRPVFDHLGNRFGTSRSIGAIEGRNEVIGSLSTSSEKRRVKIYPNPAGDRCILILNIHRPASPSISLYDLNEKFIYYILNGQLSQGEYEIHAGLPDEQGTYAVHIRLTEELLRIPIIRRKEGDG